MPPARPSTWELDAVYSDPARVPKADRSRTKAMNSNSVGFIGLGRMGFGMASNLTKAEVPLTVFDARLAPVEAINVQEAAARCQASIPVVDAMVATYKAAIDMGFGELPKSAMVKVYEKHLAQEVRLPAGDET